MKRGWESYISLSFHFFFSLILHRSDYNPRLKMKPKEKRKEGKENPTFFQLNNILNQKMFHNPVMFLM